MEKLKESILDRHELMKASHFQDLVKNIKVDAWSSFALIIKKFSWELLSRTDNYFELVENMFSSFSRLSHIIRTSKCINSTTTQIISQLW